MRILSVNSFNFQNSRYHSSINSTNSLTFFSNAQVNIMKSDEIAFKANNSNGNLLKKLKDITCPYTGKKMLLGSYVTALEKRIDKCKSIDKVVKILSKYVKYMQNVEKNMFLVFSKYIAANPNGSFNECLQNMYEDALAKLKLEEFQVLDNVDNISKDLAPKTALQVRAKTTRCREVILANDKEDSFKRRTFLNSLDEIIPINEKEKEILNKMKDQALYLPTSSSSENAFVVKYATRGDKEIAKRILRASAATIEHVKPDSKGGENDIGNFLLVSSLANSNRENMPLEKYIERHPDIPKYCQKYIKEIISAIYKGHLKGNETYPYKIKEKLIKESNGKIVLDLSKYRYSYDEAQKKEKLYLKSLHKRR